GCLIRLVQRIFNAGAEPAYSETISSPHHSIREAAGTTRERRTCMNLFRFEPGAKKSGVVVRLHHAYPEIAATRRRFLTYHRMEGICCALVPSRSNRRQLSHSAS